MVDDGWTADGRPWFAVKLSNAMINTGVFHVPAAHKALLQGEWELIGRDGQNIRELNIRDSSFWNLAPVLHRFGAEVDDIAAFLFDLSGRKTELLLGAEEIVDELQTGQVLVGASDH